MKNLLSDFLDYRDSDEKNKTNQFHRQTFGNFAVFNFMGEAISVVSKDNEFHFVNESSETKHMGVLGLSPNFGAKKNHFRIR